MAISVPNITIGRHCRQSIKRVATVPLDALMITDLTYAAALRREASADMCRFMSRCFPTPHRSIAFIKSLA